MRNITCLLSLLCLTQLLNIQVASAEDWIIEPGKSLGPITRDTSEQDLIKFFGAENVDQTTIDIGEGETQEVTEIFPDDPSKTATIFWLDTKTRKTPIGISIHRIDSDNANQKEPMWKTKESITIGTSLKTIEKLNGKPFRLLGFGWDNGGMVNDCNGGRLTELGVETRNGIEKRTLNLNFVPDSKSYGTPTYARVLGEKVFSSDNPAMQQLNPRVERISFSFPRN